jgi:hypothetical protein
MQQYDPAGSHAAAERRVIECFRAAPLPAKGLRGDETQANLRPCYAPNLSVTFDLTVWLLSKCLQTDAQFACCVVSKRSESNAQEFYGRTSRWHDKIARRTLHWFDTA